MVQCRGCFGFPPKALQSLSVARHVVGQEFERDETAQSRVLSLIDNTHPAPAEFLQDAVMRNGLADERLGLRHLAKILGCRAEASQRIGPQGGGPFFTPISAYPSPRCGDRG